MWVEHGKRWSFDIVTGLTSKVTHVASYSTFVMLRIAPDIGVGNDVDIRFSQRKLQISIQCELTNVECLALKSFLCWYVSVNEFRYHLDEEAIHPSSLPWLLSVSTHCRQVPLSFSIANAIWEVLETEGNVLNGTTSYLINFNTRWYFLRT